MRKLTLPLVAAFAAAGLAGSVAKAQDIVVATAGPITGQYASFGEQMKRGAEMAVADINAAGGLLGKMLRLEVGDDACVPEQARSVAEDLVSKGVIFVAGHFCSSSSIPASEVYAESNVLQMSPASTNPAFTEGAAEKGWRQVFRTCGRDDAQGVVAGSFLADKYTGKSVAIIHDKSTYGKGIADETKKAMNAAGLQEAMYEAINQGDKDFSALISKMKEANVEAIYLGTYHTEGGLIARQAREQGLNAQIVGEDAFVTNEFWSIAGDAGEGVLMTFAPDPRKFGSAKAIVEKFNAQGFDPEGYTLYTYAAFQVWKQAVEQAGTTDPAVLADVLRKGPEKPMAAAPAVANEKLLELTAEIAAGYLSNNEVAPSELPGVLQTIYDSVAALASGTGVGAAGWQSVLGPLQFDDKGDIVNPIYVFYKWSGGKYEELPQM